MTWTAEPRVSTIVQRAPATTPMPLSRPQTRAFVLVLVVLMLGLSVLATVMITRGWSNETVQEQVEQQHFH